MRHLSRLLLGISTLSCLASASAATHAQHSHHWSLGIQASAAKASINHSAIYQYDHTNDLYDQHLDKETSKTAALFGIHVGYNHWSNPNTLWTLSLSANEASGKATTTERFDEAIAQTSMTLLQKTELKQQYNLMLNWKRLVASDMYIKAGIGYSMLRTKSDLLPRDNELYSLTEASSDINETHYIQHKNQYGPVVSAGFECFLSEQSSFGVDLAYYMYTSAKLGRYDNLYPTDNTGTYLYNRRSAVSLIAFTFGYSHYF